MPPTGRRWKEQKNKITKLACIVGAVAAGTAAQAQDIRILTFKSDSTFVLNGQTFTITGD